MKVAGLESSLMQTCFLSTCTCRRFSIWVLLPYWQLNWWPVRHKALGYKAGKLYRLAPKHLISIQLFRFGSSQMVKMWAGCFPIENVIDVLWNSNSFGENYSEISGLAVFMVRLKYRCSPALFIIDHAMLLFSWRWISPLKCMQWYFYVTYTDRHLFAPLLKMILEAHKTMALACLCWRSQGGQMSIEWPQVEFKTQLLKSGTAYSHYLLSF